jgi:hypothetical protein
MRTLRTRGAPTSEGWTARHQLWPDRLAGWFSSAMSAVRAVQAVVERSRALCRPLTLSLVLLQVGCTLIEGPLLVKREEADAGDAARGPSRGGAVRAGMSLQYQIVGELDSAVDAQLFVVDLFETDVAQVAALHAAGRLVMAYVSAGSREPWRDDAARFPRAVLGEPLANYPNELWLDVRTSEVRKLMEERLDRAVAKGFDGVFYSTLGGYRANSGFDLTRADQLDYDKFLAEAAHARGLSAGLSGDFELANELSSVFDWAIAIGCIARDFCDELSPLKARDLPIFDLETGGDVAEVCRQAQAYGFEVTFKRPSYDGYRSVCP